MILEEREAPTEKQAEVLVFLAQWLRDHHTSPTVSEMAEHFRVQNFAVHERLRALARKGWIELPGKGRHGYRIIGATVAVVLPDGCLPDQLRTASRL